MRDILDAASMTARSRRVPLARRAVGAASRRLGRPELLAALYPHAAQMLREEIAIAAILPAVLRSDATFVDVGTNRGQILREAVRLAPAGRHIAFEPIPALAEELSSSFPDVDCRQLALGARAEVAEFCHFTSLDGWSGLRRSPEISDERGHPQYIEVQVSTLDAELSGLRASVIKIDVEGAELQVLDGAGAVLSSAAPVVIFEHVAAAAQLYGSQSGSLWDRFTELGYRVFAVTGDGPVTRSAFVNSTRIVNWLATPSLLPAG
jgi:FkbM family methyltransferase